MTAEEISVSIFPLEGLGKLDSQADASSVFAGEIVTHLSRYQQFHIIPPVVNLKAREEANYSIKISFQITAARVRFNVHLINNHTNRLTWAEVFEFDITDDTSRDVTMARIASALQQNVTLDLLRILKQKSSNSLTAYEHWLLGMEEIKLGSADADERARVHFSMAIDNNPTFSLAYSGMSLSYFNEWSCQLWERWDVSHQGAYDWARRAIELDSRNHVAAMVLGRVLVYEAKYDVAEHYLRKALELNTTDPDNLIQIASCFVYLEKLDEAADLFNKALSLSKGSEEQYYYVGALIAFERGDYHECIRLSTNGVLLWVDSFEILAAAYFEVGDLDMASKSWNIFLDHFKKKILKDQRAPDPQEAIKWVVNVSPYKGETRQRRFWEQFGGKQVAFSKRVFKEASPPQPQNFFFRENDLWLIGYEGQSTRMPAIKGLNDLAILLSSANKSVHCSQLIGGGIKAHAFEVIDQKALTSFKNRLKVLQEEIEWNEQHAVGNSAIREEYDQLLDTIASATGLGGKLRKADDPMEKIRAAVTLRIRSAIKKISNSHPALSKHLENSVKTGLFCTYSPEKPVTWSVEF